MWVLLPNFTHFASLIPSTNGLTASSLAPSFVPLITKVGTLIVLALSMAAQPRRLPVTSNSFGPFLTHPNVRPVSPTLSSQHRKYSHSQINSPILLRPLKASLKPLWPRRDGTHMLLEELILHDVLILLTVSRPRILMLLHHILHFLGQLLPILHIRIIPRLQ